MRALLSDNRHFAGKEKPACAGKNAERRCNKLPALRSVAHGSRGARTLSRRQSTPRTQRGSFCAGLQFTVSTKLSVRKPMVTFRIERTTQGGGRCSGHVNSARLPGGDEGGIDQSGCSDPGRFQSRSACAHRKRYFPGTAPVGSSKRSLPAWFQMKNGTQRKARDGG